MSSTTVRPTSRKAPGPKPRGLLGNAKEFTRDRLGFLDECFHQYGDFVSIRLVNRRVLIVNHPDQVEEVLVTRNRDFIKHFALRSAKMNLGEGLLTSDGDFWRRQRKLAQPAFHRERIAGYASVMVEYTERMLKGWADGQARDIQDDMMRLTLEIVAKTLFDADVSDQSSDVSQAMEVLMRNFNKTIGRLVKLPNWIPTPFNIQGNRARKGLNDIIFRIIAERRASGENRGDLLSMLLHAQDEESGVGMTDRQLRDEAMTLFLAGHETTANTLAWVFWLLAQNPDAEAKLFAELDSVLQGRAPTFDDLPRLPYADAVVTESLRLYPTVWLIGREAIVPTEVGGLAVAKGDTVYMSQWVIHRDPRNFDDPLTYKPDRWLDGLAKRIHRYAYFPFGGGPRICVGNQFAQMESVLLLASIARKYRLTLAPDADVVLLPTMTLRADHGVKVILHERGR